MSEFNENIFNALIKNASTFLNCAIRAINQGLSNQNNKIIAIVNLQMALELSMKAKVVENYGVSYIIEGLSTAISDAEIQERYERNELRVKEFESIKNFLKATRMFDFEREEYKFMSRFQIYRNRLVHFNYNFSEEENDQIEHEIFYMLVYLLGTIMSDVSDENNPTFMQEYIDMKQYRQLMQNTNYTDLLNEFIETVHGNTLYCPICSRKFLTPTKKCLGCLYDVSEKTGAFGYIDCKICRVESAVIYDKLNIGINKGMLRGLCINCMSDTIVYECPRCGQAYDFEGLEEKCTPHQCINEN